MGNGFAAKTNWPTRANDIYSCIWPSAELIIDQPLTGEQNTLMRNMAEPKTGQNGDISQIGNKNLIYLCLSVATFSPEKQNTREKIYRYSVPDTEANERGKRIEEPLVSDQVTK